MALVLTIRSVLMCPHGGIVSVDPVTITSYRIDGYRPLLMSDVFTVAGCGFSSGGAQMPCLLVNWVVASTLMTVKGIPVLTSSSVGMMSGVGPPVPVIIAAVQSSMEEPSDITNIDY